MLSFTTIRRLKKNMYKNKSECEDSVENTEEIIYKAYDNSWRRDMPIKLITYKNGSMDIHRQTGSEFEAHMKEAEKILNKRGLEIKKHEPGLIGPTGWYQSVGPLDTVEKRPAENSEEEQT